MNSENVFFYSILSFIGMVGIFIAFMVLRYLNRKALGMQTILDELFIIAAIMIEFIWLYLFGLLI